jgi:hypothetical protein
MENGILRFQFVHFVPLLLCPFEPTGSTNYNIFPDMLFMQNKANFQKAIINVNSYMKSKYEKSDTCWIEKTKPIQSQNKPKQSQFWPITRPGKAKTNPIQSQFRTILAALTIICTTAILSFLSFYMDKLLK